MHFKVPAAICSVRSLFYNPVRNKELNVFFVVKTGSSHTYLSQHALRALEYRNPLPEEIFVLVNGIKAQIRPSPFPDVTTCFLGGNWMVERGLITEIRFSTF